MKCWAIMEYENNLIVDIYDNESDAKRKLREWNQFSFSFYSPEYKLEEFSFVDLVKLFARVQKMVTEIQDRLDRF